MSVSSSADGFTILELLVALVVVIIVTLVAVPSLTSFFQEYRTTASTQLLFYTLQYARSEAIKLNQAVYVSFQTGSNWCYGVNAGSTCTCSIANNCGLGTTSAPQADQLTLSTTGMSNNSISFGSTQGTTGAASNVTFTAYGQSTAVGIDITILGDMQMCSSNVSGFSPC